MATKNKKQSTKNKKSTKKLNFGKMSPLKMLVAVVVVAAISGLGTYMLTKGKAASGGYGHTCAIKADKTLWCSGLNDYGQLGIGYKTDRLAPAQEQQLIPKQVNIAGVTSVSVGALHTCATKTDGTLWCWGMNSYGQLGTGKSRDYIQTLPKQVNIRGVASVDAGWLHTCATKTDGTVWCWGQNVYGELGVGKTRYDLHGKQYTPKQVNIAGVATVDAGMNHTCATKTDGTLWCWGYTSLGALGLGTYNGNVKCIEPVCPANGEWPIQDTPIQVNISGVASVSAGSSYTCATKTDGMLWCWGYNDSGQLGLGYNTSRYAPIQEQQNIPKQVNIAGVASVSALGQTCATKTDGTLWCWGYNGSSGKLGIGNTDNQNLPVQVNISGVASVTAAGFHTCAEKTDRSVWCWGSNFWGQYGNGNNISSYVPTRGGW